jgi:prepilin-type N-terminal cleavage/methylation domain-containing protein
MKNRAHGFVLLELIVAMTILGIGFSVFFASMSGSARNITRLERFQIREQSTRNLLAELDLIQSLRADDSASGTFGDGTRWHLDVEPFVQSLQNPTSVVRIVLRLEWDGSSGIQTRTIETYRLARNITANARSLGDQLRELQ